jgi:hypothetical protein
METSPVAPELTLPATPAAVDAVIAEYETALADLAILQKRAGSLKLNLIAIVTACGVMPPTAKSSKRIEGLTHKATVTYGSSTTLDEEGIAKLHAYLVDKEMPEIFEKFYALQIPAVYVPPPPRHMKVAGPVEVFEALTTKIGTAIKTKIAALFALTQHTRPNAPSLKVEPVKPPKK